MEAPVAGGRGKRYISHREREQDEQPEEARHDHDPGEVRAPPHVHEEQDDERRFRTRDEQHDDVVQGTHVDLGGGVRQDSADDQRQEER